MFSCENDDALEGDFENNLEFQGNNAILSSTDLSCLRFKDVPAMVSLDETAQQGQIRIEASSELSEWLEVKKEGVELHIIGRNIGSTSLDLQFYIHPNDVRKIVIEGENKIEIASTPVLEYLELVTEGESQLVIHNLKVRNLASRREGKSHMFLSSRVVDFDSDSTFFLYNSVQVIDDNYILYQEDGSDYLIFAPRIEIREDSVFALGNNTSDPISSYFVTHSHDLRNEGESFLDALELPTNSVISKNEGKSEANVWVIQNLNIKGEGESTMNYIGSPVIDQKLEGASTLVKLP